MASGSRATVHELPPELLNHIFHFVHEASKAEYLHADFERCLTRPESEDYNDDEFPMKAAGLDRIEMAQFTTIQRQIISSLPESDFFPYALAAVCPFWENVLSLSPEFWTRLVFTVGLYQTSFEQASKYLAWSSELPLDVFIVNRDNRGNYRTAFEQEIVASFLELLRPHMKRLRSLQMEVYLNTTLPDLHIIPRYASALQALHMRSIVGDATRPDMDFDNGKSGESFDGGEANSLERHRPRLQMMTIDGQTFRRALKNPPSWFKYQPQLRRLEIEEIRDDHDATEIGWLRHDISLSATLRLIHTGLSHTLTSLTLSRLMFKLDMESNPDSSLQFENLQALSLRDLSAEAISEICRVSSMPSLFILQLQKCFGVSPDIFLDIETEVDVLTLEDYGIDESNHNMSEDDKITRQQSDLVRLVSGWYGVILQASGIQGSFDPVIEELSVNNPDAPEDFICNDFSVLELANCSPPSFRSMKRMIERRNVSINYDDPSWRSHSYEGPAVLKCCFRNCEPRWSAVEMEWLRERLVDFSWE